MLGTSPGVGNDVLDGGNGDDTLVGGLGDDFLYGRNGSDTAAFNGTWSQYTLTSTATGWALTGSDGVDTLSGIEFANFTDQSRYLDNFAPTGSVTISGSVIQNQTLTVANTLADIDGLGIISYQWKAGGSNIADATATTYVLTEAQVGKVIAVTASYTDLHGTMESVTNAATETVTNVNDYPTGSVTISGTASQGEILSAANTLVDVDGLGTISYQWKADGDAIAGATKSTFALTEAEVGKAITVAASYIDGHDTAESVTSSATTAVANVNDAPTGSVTIAGTAIQDRTLTATNILADADGLGTIGYQWRASGSDISGATASTLVLAEAQVGKLITVAVSYTDAHGTAESVTSSSTSAVANVNDAPTLANALADRTAIENFAFSFIVRANAFADADVGDTLTYSATRADGTALPTWLAFNVSTRTFSGTPGASDIGTIDIKVTATDSGNASTTDVFALVVGDATTGKTLDFLAYSWKVHTLLDSVSIAADTTPAPQTTDTSGGASFTGITDTILPLTVARTIPSTEATLTDQAVNLQDAIAILKLIVGLEVNGAGKPLSPYQALAADFDTNAQVQLTDAIGVLKHVVGLSAPAPAWHFVSETDSAIPQVAALSPGAAPAITLDLSGAASTVQVGLVAYLSGDVDGSYAGPVDAVDLDDVQPDYFVALTQAHGLDPAQFGVY